MFWIALPQDSNYVFLVGLCHVSSVCRRVARAGLAGGFAVYLQLESAAARTVLRHHQLVTNI